MSLYIQTFLTTLHQTAEAPVVAAAEAFYAQMKDLSDEEALAHTRELCAHLLPMKAQMDGSDIGGRSSRMLTDNAFDAMHEAVSKAFVTAKGPDGQPLSASARADIWKEVIGALSASELLPDRAKSRPTGKALRVSPTEKEQQALNILNSEPATSASVDDFLRALGSQTTEDLLRAIRLVRDHLPHGQPNWYFPYVLNKNGETRVTPMVSWQSNVGQAVRLALAGRIDGATAYFCESLVEGWREFSKDGYTAPAMPTAEEDAALRQAGQSERPVQALYDLLSQVDDPNTARRLARGVRDRWYVYAACPQVAGKKYVNTIEEALLRGWNLMRTATAGQTRAQLRDILITHLMEPTMKHSPAPEPLPDARRQPGRRP